MQSQIDQIIASSGEAQIAAVNAEATARQNADATLQDNIDAEATARANADTTLQDNIDAEATARQIADTAINSALAVVDKKASKLMYNFEMVKGFAKYETGHESLLLQGACYDSKREQIVVAFTNNTNGYVVIYDKYANELNNVTVNGWGHANDLTYNFDNDRIYVATGTTSILEINPNNFSITNIVNAGFNVWNISYYKNDVYFIGDGNNWYKSDGLDSFVLFGSYHNSEIAEIYGTISTTQGSFVYDDQLYSLNSINDVNRGETGVIVRFTKDGELDTSISNNYIGEVEDAFVINNYLYVITGQSYLTFQRTPIGELVTHSVNEFNTFDVGKEIFANNDLNDFKTLGNFTCYSSSVSDTLTNKPPFTIGPFTLTVRRIGSLHLLQEIVNYNANCIFRRIYGYSTNRWSDWEQVLTIPNSYTFNNINVITNGFITLDGRHAMFEIPLYKLPNKSYGGGTDYSVIDVSSLKLTVRQNGNYILGSGSTGEEVISSTYLVDKTLTPLGVLFNVSRADDAILSADATNNDCIAVQIFITFTITRPIL